MMELSMYLPPSATAGVEHPPPNLTPPSSNPIFDAAASAAALHTHPPYEEMIITAIEALKEKNGSSRQAIAKYIQHAYTNLPPAHPAMLTHHLKRMKKAGQLVMIKYSYMLAGSEFSSFPYTAAPPVAPAAVPPQFTLTTSVPVAEPETNGNMFGQAPDLNGPGQEMAVVVKRGRGRPPKLRLNTDGNVTVKKTVVRPRKPVNQTMPLPKRRGRPRKDAGIAVSSMPSPWPGRRPNVGGAGRKHMKFPRIPVGGQKTNRESALGPAEPKWMVDYVHVRVKLQRIQTRMQQAIGDLKAHLSNESLSDLRVAAALQELDVLSTVDVMSATLAADGDQEPPQAAEQIHADSQVPPQPADLNQQHHYNHEDDEHVL
uniref:H15 domain-containing protein n=1 Tax=Kalanchoe fedtschenkoi TaxID=63787 RepID=A0A7N0VAJ5_KALFE